MIHLKYKSRFPHIYRHENLLIKTCFPLDPLHLGEINTFAQTPLPGKIRKSTHISKNRTHFLKLSKIKSLSKQLRISLGMAKSFDYYLKELENNIRLADFPVPAPRLAGYFLYTRMGLTQRAGLIFENMVGQENAANYVKSNPEKKASIIEGGLRVLSSLHCCSIFHMDPRLENLMVDATAPHQLSIIDFEHCYFGEPANVMAITGMVYGMFYRSGVEAHISEAEYDTLVYSILDPSARENPDFNEAYRTAKRRFMERTECKRMFISGKR